MNLTRRLERLEASWMCPTHRQAYQCLTCPLGELSPDERGYVDEMVVKAGLEGFNTLSYAEAWCGRCGEPMLCLACQPPMDEAAQARYLAGIRRLTADEQHRLADILEKVAGRA